MWVNVFVLYTYSMCYTRAYTHTHTYMYTYSRTHIFKNMHYKPFYLYLFILHNAFHAL